jgi:hypothetical protein
VLDPDSLVSISSGKLTTLASGTGLDVALAFMKQLGNKSFRCSGVEKDNSTLPSSI